MSAVGLVRALGGWLRALGHKEDPAALVPVATDRDDSERRALWFDWIVDNESPWQGSYLATAADGALYLVQPPPRATAATAVPLAHAQQPNPAERQRQGETPGGGAC